MANRPISISINGEPKELTPENVGIAMFRHDPELDYVDVHEPIEGEENERHTLVYGQRKLLLWMGHICLKDEDVEIARKAERELGSFTLQSGGWRPPVMIEDYASDWEKEMYVRSQLPADEDWHIDLEHALEDEFHED